MKKQAIFISAILGCVFVFVDLAEPKTTKPNLFSDTPSPTPTSTVRPPTPTPTSTQCIPEFCWLSRRLPDTCFPGQVFDVRAELQGGSATICLVIETVPEGWIVIDPPWDSHTGDTYTWRSGYRMRHSSGFERDSYLYTIQVPEDAILGVYRFSGWTESYHWCNGYHEMDTDGDQTIRVVSPPPPLSSMTPTPAPTATPTVAFIEPCQSGVVITMPEDEFVPGDHCSCSAYICNSSDYALIEYPLVVVLCIGDVYFFAPGFSGFDFYLKNYPPGQTRIEILPDFVWPENAGAFSGAFWLAALTDPDMEKILGDYGVFHFNWNE